MKPLNEPYIYKHKGINWYRVGKYVALILAGAGGGVALAHYINPKDIADLLGVKSQHVGMETAIAVEKIEKWGPLIFGSLGGELGALVAYLHDREYRR